MLPAVFLLNMVLLSFSAADPVAQSDLPRNLWVQAQLRPYVAELWHGSPTFRAQCRKLGAQRNYHVHIVIDPTLATMRRARAQCQLRVYESGMVIARISVPSRQSLSELIPHELEHVSEHIDGVNLKRELHRRSADVYDVGDGRLETRRAIHAGRQASLEMSAVGTLTRR